ncbi:protein mono-ADP-ribosyltransferase TIPARP-like [Rhinatrema bivittatum]|uniref:protein mono-ADP-ribosyltransferase TIPARP-like n=1 Tax=Rhinatrema bivittatum TaxID=194408 RepID=UPI001125EAC5|nr:protein mono-ADP-ribosyltransferase TIPARP-like [Rhinatrema bivittatum]XP_029437513.1 protein mono-ADP-ribosyltransferase TIPARP-like [Rhinatrema bivittatum]XP_029437514.1 protein mono-ADP-ribosyltransferase TIPARP-like [Rhinatrema bivittatum]
MAGSHDTAPAPISCGTAAGIGSRKCQGSVATSWRCHQSRWRRHRPRPALLPLRQRGYKDVGGLMKRAEGQALATPSAKTDTMETVERALQQVEVAVQTDREPTPPEQAEDEEATISHILELIAQLEYHTHSMEGVEICPDFLLGCCFRGRQCPRHHTALPYHWQLWHRGTHCWENVGADGQEALERAYSDPARTLVQAVYRDLPFVIDLQSMLVWDSKVFQHVRRLSTAASSDVRFHTAYKYYYQLESGWQEYSWSFSQRIQEALRAGATELRCGTLQYEYLLDLRSGCQQNLSTGTKRAIRCRPTFQAPGLMLPQLRTLSGSELCPLSPTPAAGQPGLGPEYPETWKSIDPALDFSQEPVRPQERAYHLIYSLFHKTMPESKYIIVGISRVQNLFLWDKYRRKREHMCRRMSEEERALNERHLFHGTVSCAVDAICKHNFDPRLSGKHAALYGQGSYFARKASYSHRYASSSASGHHYVFLSKVLVGKSARGLGSLRRPPALLPGSATSDLYDSCVDSLEEPQIYVIFDSDQCYPYFIIKYKEIAGAVRLD